jgi:hypothetical protein
MFVSLMVHGAGPKEFFQVLVLEADSFDAARAAARAFLARRGMRWIAFDESETGEVLLESVRLARVDANPDGVVAASGCIFFDGDDES